jgi:hypothetical protein
MHLRARANRFCTSQTVLNQVFHAWPTGTGAIVLPHSGSLLDTGGHT